MRKNIVPSSIYLSTSSLLATLGTKVVTPDLIIDVIRKGIQQQTESSVVQTSLKGFVSIIANLL